MGLLSAVFSGNSRKCKSMPRPAGCSKIVLKIKGCRHKTQGISHNFKAIRLLYTLLLTIKICDILPLKKALAMLWITPPCYGSPTPGRETLKVEMMQTAGEYGGASNRAKEVQARWGGLSWAGQVWAWQVGCGLGCSWSALRPASFPGNPHHVPGHPHHLPPIHTATDTALPPHCVTLDGHI